MCSVGSTEKPFRRMPPPRYRPDDYKTSCRREPRGRVVSDRFHRATRCLITSFPGVEWLMACGSSRGRKLWDGTGSARCDVQWQQWHA